MIWGENPLFSETSILLMVSETPRPQPAGMVLFYPVNNGRFQRPTSLNWDGFLAGVRTLPSTTYPISSQFEGTQKTPCHWRSALGKVCFVCEAAHPNRVPCIERSKSSSRQPIFLHWTMSELYTFLSQKLTEISPSLEPQSQNQPLNQLWDRPIVIINPTLPIPSSNSGFMSGLTIVNQLVD